MTATAFSSVSLAPPLVLLCIQKKSTVHDPLTTAPVFGVSVLDESQRTIAEQCARPGLDRFKDVPMRAGAALGAPLVDGALVTLECRRFAAHDAGDHTILVGEVDGSTSRDGAPLLYGNRSFGRFTKDA
jgi:flavin reductase (DIM6/NTAB) family NADH-FMN oxidoreductase RutF